MAVGIYWIGYDLTTNSLRDILVIGGNNMLTGSFTMFSLTTNGHKFSVDCLKGIAKDNKGKVCKIGKGTGIIHNIRYYKKQVIADFSFPNLLINTSGKIITELSLVKGRVVTEFKIDKIELTETKG